MTEKRSAEEIEQQRLEQERRAQDWKPPEPTGRPGRIEQKPEPDAENIVPAKGEPGTL